MGDIIARGLAQKNAKTYGYLYNFQCLSNFYAKLAKSMALGAVCDVNWVCDSLGVGQDSGNGLIAGTDASLFPTKGTIGRLQALINSTSQPFGDAGLGFCPSYNPEGAPNVNYSGGTWTDFSFGGITSKGKFSSVNNNTFTFTFVGTGVGIMYLRNSASSDMQVTVDGVDQTIVHTYNSAGQIDSTVVEFNGFTNGTHTVVVKCLTDSGSRTRLYFIGYYPIKTGGALRINMMGRSSMKASDHIPTYSTACTILGMPNPALTIISLQANDFSGQTALSTYRTNIQTLITKALTVGDVILESCVHASVGAIPLTSYAQVLYDLAVLNNIAYYDFAGELGGTWTTANAKQCVTSPVHYNDVGCQLRANRWFEILTK